MDPSLCKDKRTDAVLFNRVCIDLLTHQHQFYGNGLICIAMEKLREPLKVSLDLQLNSFVKNEILVLFFNLLMTFLKGFKIKKVVINSIFLYKYV